MQSASGLASAVLQRLHATAQGSITYPDGLGDSQARVGLGAGSPSANRAEKAHGLRRGRALAPSDACRADGCAKTGVAVSHR